MNRTFKQFTIQAGGTPQPLVGSWVTATTAPNGADFQGEILTTYPVNDSSMFAQGDYVRFVKANLTQIEIGRVQSVPDGTHIQVRGITLTRTGGAFGTGDFVQLFLPVNRVYVQCKPGNAAIIFIGTQGLNKTGLVNVIAQLQPFGSSVQPIEYVDNRNYTADPMNAADLWIDGTTSDGYLPSFGVA